MTKCKTLTTTGALGVLFLLLSASASATENTTEKGLMLSLSCAACHGTDGIGSKEIPALKGQSKEIIQQKLLHFKAGDGKPTVMDRHAKGYTDQEIERAMSNKKITRREFGKISGAVVAGGVLVSCTGMGKGTDAGKMPGKADVVIVGGGFGGATCAKYLKKFNPDCP
ncbi:hypothetical protein CHS0354_002067 [Potamilus streckersoni]|uniref:Cytochrome c domain-containing protein n=1 Tax=Potamilus streckersoni TaxID=2493646 RepID=A0AAE0W7S5_9BIVA|nr:hypothetical protein CHS0354_002067 [Potamilus streckersoni]